MTPQPSGEAVALVAAALRAEREVTAHEDMLRALGIPLASARHAALVKQGDNATDALHAYIVGLEQRARDAYINGFLDGTRGFDGLSLEERRNHAAHGAERYLAHLAERAA